jgi:hypothetical protein
VPLEPGSWLPSPLPRGGSQAQQPMTNTVAGQREASFLSVEGLEMPNTGDLYLRGTQAQTRWSSALDGECAKWKKE